MSKPPVKVLALVPGHVIPAETLQALGGSSVSSELEIFLLNPQTAPLALEKIFAADHILVWGEL